jgi:spore photoproduct lyase
MISAIYIEQAVSAHPTTQAIRRRFPDAQIIPIERYSEVFNRKAQNFRLQKNRPALILAAKHEGFVLPAPPGYGIGMPCNFYMSHMLNCVYLGWGAGGGVGGSTSSTRGVSAAKSAVSN